MTTPPSPRGGSRGESTVSVVIATRNRPTLLRRCLEAVAAQEPPPLEILVVDNTQGDAAARTVASEAGARYLVEPVVGVSRARNHGARAAAGDIVALVDDDAVPEPGWLAGLAAEFEDARVAAVSGRILALARDAALNGRVLFGGSDRVVLDRSSPDWFGRAGFGGLGQGSNLAFSRGVFDSSGGFDERLGAGTRVGGAEEHYFFFSLVERGYRVVYTPDAKVSHPVADAGDEVQLRHLRDLRAAAFLLMLILVERPRLRREALSFALEALRGTDRHWRITVPEAKQQGWRAVQMRLAGAGLYLLSRAEAPSRTWLQP